MSALVAGPSGTGKTLAAEVFANELHVDLHRIDLWQAVSKYISATEKNLRRILDAPKQSGAILLFDESDALFREPSEVKNSHHRYANIGVSYLLQRMEAYRGRAFPRRTREARSVRRSCAAFASFSASLFRCCAAQNDLVLSVCFCSAPLTRPCDGDACGGAFGR